MPLAGVRARLPHALPLTPADINAFGAGGIQLITMREEENFAPKSEVRPLPATARIAVGAVTVQRIQTGIHLYYRYTSMTGAPDRSHRPPIEFDVANGRRARVAFNGRFSGYSIEWLYKLSIITVSVGITPNEELFTGSVAHAIEDLGELL